MLKIKSLLILPVAFAPQFANAIPTSSHLFYDGATETTVCSDFGSTGASCESMAYIYDSKTDRYAVVLADSTSRAEGTSLKARSNTVFDGGYTREQMIERVKQDIGLTDEMSDDEFFEIYDRYPEYFEGESLEFQAGAFLDDQAITDSKQFQAYTGTELEDTWTITGGEDGESGVVSIAYRVDGTINNDDLQWDGGSTSGGLNGGSATLRFIEKKTEVFNGIPTTYAAQADGQALLSDGIFDEIIELELDFIFGQAMDVELQFNAVSGYDYLSVPFTGMPESFTQLSDFFNTALFSGMTVKDSSGGNVDFSLKSENGIPEFSREGNGNTPVQVNEPASLVLLSLSLAAIAGFRRRSV